MRWARTELRIIPGSPRRRCCFLRSRWYGRQRVSRLSLLSEQIQDRLTRADGARETILSHTKIERNTQCMVDRGAEVLWAHRLVLDRGPDLVGFAIDYSAANPAARK